MPAALESQEIPGRELTGGVVYFDAKATMGNFTAWNTAVTGRFDRAASLEGVKGVVEVDAGRFNTSSRLRDKHMRRHVEVEKYPTWRFQLDSVSTAGEPADTFPVVLHGTMEIHGTARVMDLRARLHIDSGGAHLWLDPRKLDMRDFNLEAPRRFVIARMDPVVTIRGEFIFGKPKTAPDP